MCCTCMSAVTCAALPRALMLASVPSVDSPLLFSLLLRVLDYGPFTFYYLIVVIL